MYHVRGFDENLWFALVLQLIQHSLRKIIMLWYCKTVAYQFWFLKLKNNFRYLDLNHIFIHLQVAPSVANLCKQTKLLWTVWRTNQNWQSLKETLYYICIWHYTIKPVFTFLISKLMNGCIICFNEEGKIDFKMSWITEANAKIFVQKGLFQRAILKNNFWKSPFLQNFVH